MTATIRKSLLLAALTVAGLTSDARAQVEEELRYRWRLGGYKGFFARLVVPGTGDAVLRTTAREPGVFLNELHITSPKSRRGEFWLYGSEVRGADCGVLLKAWNEQLFRGRSKRREAEIERDGVLDIPSCICRIRRRPPEQAIATRIWSDGKTYPIQISRPAVGETRLGGRSIGIHTYTVSALKRPNERVWKGRLVLVVALDEERTPLEIVLMQPGVTVRLELDEEL